MIMNRWLSWQRSWVKPHRVDPTCSLIWTGLSHLEIFSKLRILQTTWEIWWFMKDDQNLLCKILWNVIQSQEEFLKEDQIFICKFLSYRKVWYIKLYVICEINPIMGSKLLMDIILGVSKILHGSGRVNNPWCKKDSPWIRKGSWRMIRTCLKDQLVCTLQDKSDYGVTITYGHHPWCQKDPPWIRKGSWGMIRMYIC